MSTLRRGLGSIPRAAWACASVGLLCATVWALIIPPLQNPDEPGHVAYVQYLAEKGEPPSNDRPLAAYSDQERALMHALRFKLVQFRPHNRAPTTAQGRRRLQRALDAPLSPVGGGGYTNAGNNPPLYYAMETVAYAASPSHNLLDRMYMMRILSALLAGLTVLLCFLFLRELLPGTPWAWTVGALAVALQPVFGNLGGAVHSDNVLYPAAAGTLFALAYSFRRDLTVGSGAAVGIGLVAGVLAKPTMIGLAPGIALGLGLLVWRTEPEKRRAAIGGVVAATACVALPLLVYVFLNDHVWARGQYFSSASAGESPKPVADQTQPTFTGLLSYIWQFYLPRLPWMESQFHNYQVRNVWFNGFVGRFGVLDYGFGSVVQTAAAVVFAAIAGLAVRELVRCRDALKARWAELITYLAIAAGLIYAIHKSGYDARSLYLNGFEQARYLFPMLALYGAVIALAARGAGRRWGPVVGVLLVSLAVAQTLLAFLLTLTRYYG